jgi:hypothetical protein
MTCSNPYLALTPNRNLFNGFDGMDSM